MPDCCCCKKYYIIANLTPFYIVTIIIFLLSFFDSQLDKEKYDALKKNWEKSPIISISLDQNYVNNLKGKIYQNNVTALNKALTIKRLDKKYNYEYLLREDMNEPGFHPCGKDWEGNYLFLPNDIECPINEIEISSSSDPKSVKKGNTIYCNYKTVQIYKGIYLHYSNENINSTILTDIYFKIDDSYSNYSEPYRQIFFKSRENNFLYLIMENYFGFHFDNPIIDGKRDLIDFKNFLHYGNKLYLNITSLIVLILSLVTLIIDNCSEEREIPIFRMLTIFFLYALLVIQIIIYKYYIEIETLDNVLTKFFDFYSGYFNYNSLVLILIAIITGIYLCMANRKGENENNYYLVYCFRYILFNKCCLCCEERNRAKNNRIIRELEDKVKNLDDKISECDKEKRKLIDKNEKILKEIVNKSKILNNMKDEENSFWKMNEEEENKFEKKFKQLKNDNELNIRKFKNLKNQIKRFEKEINYYKMVEFKQELNNK